jgi:hypothetical protein
LSRACLGKNSVLYINGSIRPSQDGVDLSPVIFGAMGNPPDPEIEVRRLISRNAFSCQCRRLILAVKNEK